MMKGFRHMYPFSILVLCPENEAEAKDRKRSLVLQGKQVT